MSVFKCSMCSFVCASGDKFLAHYTRYHKLDPNFIVFCTVENCEYSTKSWGAFKKHVSRKHGNTFAENRVIDESHEGAVGEDGGEDVVTNDGAMLDEDTLLGDVLGDAEKLNARFALAVSSQHNLTEKAVDDVISHTGALIEYHTKALQSKVKAELDKRNIPSDFVDDMHTEHHLQKVNTSYKRETAYVKDLGLVKPQEVVLGSKLVTKQGQIKQVQNKGYYIPFKESIEALLQQPDVWKVVREGHCSDSEYMFDICDGAYIKNSQLHSQNPSALQIVLNTDDLEVVNPLGVSTKNIN